MSPRSSASSPDWLALAVKHFGPGILVAAVFGYSTVRVYDDLSRKNDLFVDVIREEVRTSQAVTKALETLTERVESQSRAIEALSKNP